MTDLYEVEEEEHKLELEVVMSNGNGGRKEEKRSVVVRRAEMGMIAEQIVQAA